MTQQRIQKVLAKAGLGSRREMEQAIAAGRVQVNGQPATLGDKVTTDDELCLDGRPVKQAALSYRRLLVYNKPEGEVCTRHDPEQRPTVFDHLPQLADERWIAIGRLDINTSGLLLFTNDGELATRLMHPAYKIEREYAVRILGDVQQRHVDAMCAGVQLDDGLARFSDVQFFRGSGANRWFHVVIMEGRNREVRRLWESQGLQVSRLKRVRFGSVFLAASVRAGTWQEASKGEVNKLAALVGLTPAPWASIVRHRRDPVKRQMEKQRTRRSVRGG